MLFSFPPGPSFITVNRISNWQIFRRQPSLRRLWYDGGKEGGSFGIVKTKFRPTGNLFSCIRTGRQQRWWWKIAFNRIAVILINDLLVVVSLALADWLVGWLAGRSIHTGSYLKKFPFAVTWIRGNWVHNYRLMDEHHRTGQSVCPRNQRIKRVVEVAERRLRFMHSAG